MSIPITITGRLGRIDDLSFTTTGTARLGLAVATSKRIRDKDTGKWSDGPTTWINVTAWRDLAEAVTEANLDKGTEVIVSGELAERTWTGKDGQERRSMDLTARSIAPVISSRQQVRVTRGVTRTTTAENDEWGTW